MGNKKLIIENKKFSATALTTDDVPQGIKNIYLSESGGLTDNLLMAPNFNLVSGKLDYHLTNTNNPHSQILSGIRTHQTQINLTQDITLNISEYIDCLLVQPSNLNDRIITVPNEDDIGQQFATNAAFTAFRLGTANLTIKLAAGVSFANASGFMISLPVPQTSYYLFIRQAKNQWAVVTYSSGGSGSEVVIKWDGSTLPVEVTAGNGISIGGGVIAVTTPQTLQGIYDNSSPKQINFGANQGLVLNGDSLTSQINFSGLKQFSLNISTSFTSAIQQIDSTTQGWMGPRATVIERNLIDVSQNPVGLETFNTTDKTKDYWDGTKWQQVLTIDHLLAGTGISVVDNVDGTVTVNSTAGTNLTLQDAYDNSSDGVITVTPVKPFQIKDSLGNSIAEFGQTYSSAAKTTNVTGNFTLTADAAVNVFVLENIIHCTLTLPTTAAEGQIFKIIGGNATWQIIRANTNQFIHVFYNGSSFAATDLSSNLPWESVELSVRTADFDFVLTQTNAPQLNFNY